MKKLNLVIILAYLCLSVKAQTLISKTDKLTGKVMKMAYIYLKMPHLDNQSLTFQNYDNKKIIGTAITGAIGADIYNNFKIDNLSIIVKFDDGKILHLKLDTTSQKFYSSSLGATVILNHTLSQDEINQFLNDKIELIRIGLNGDNGIDYSAIDEKKQKEILKAVEYIN